MTTRCGNSFLPSGAVNMPGPYYDVPNYQTCPNTINTIFHHHHHPHLLADQISVMSPPKTRSASTENCNGMLTEDWSAFVQHLRNQFKGERAHLKADRDRMQEIIEGERELWERERQLWNKERRALRAQIIDLETRLSVFDSTLNLNQTSSLSNRKISLTGSKNIDGSVINKIPQESGRNADGSPFYAPAPQNPTRTFDVEIASELRVDDLAAPQETAIRVTSKELTSLDFIQQMTPPLTTLSTQEVVAEAIDISCIQPELDGVAIRISAVSPSFAAKALLPQSSSSSSNSQTKGKTVLCDETRIQHERRHSEEDSGQSFFSQPENKRLTLFAGHTPNHSVTKFDLDSGSATPAKILSSETKCTESIDTEKQEFDRTSPESKDDGDKILNEPLGLTNLDATNAIFLTQLTEKLAQEVRKSADLSLPSELGATQTDLSESPPLSSTHGNEESEGPILRMKPSLNFGRPFGAI